MVANGDKVPVRPGGGLRYAWEVWKSLTSSPLFYRLAMVVVLVGIWQLMSDFYHSDIVLPAPYKTVRTLLTAVHDPEVLENLFITIRRVLTGFALALVVGIPLGFLMGFSRRALLFFEPLIDSVRQVPVMAWVPLTIVWFGLGDGPTLFLIALTGTFPIVLNTIAGVQGISREYYDAARSLGAGPLGVFLHVIVPGSMPGILTGGRLAVGLGWMSVI